jgi:excisionase family DNA binding protein
MQPDGERTHDTTEEPLRMTVAQAASYLGISSEAVRARIQRGTLEHTKENERQDVRTIA